MWYTPKRNDIPGKEPALNGDLTGEDRNTICEPNLAMTLLEAGPTLPTRPKGVPSTSDRITQSQPRRENICKVTPESSETQTYKGTPRGVTGRH